MPKYFPFKIADHYLYFTSQCIVEAMHVHASDRRLTEAGSGKLFVKENGDTVLQRQGTMTDRQERIIREFIKENYVGMYKKWKDFGGGDFYHG